MVKQQWLPLRQPCCRHCSVYLGTIHILSKHIFMNFGPPFPPYKYLRNLWMVLSILCLVSTKKCSTTCFGNWDLHIKVLSNNYISSQSDHSGSILFHSAELFSKLFLLFFKSPQYSEDWCPFALVRIQFLLWSAYSSRGWTKKSTLGQISK